MERGREERGERVKRGGRGGRGRKEGRRKKQDGGIFANYMHSIQARISVLVLTAIPP